MKELLHEIASIIRNSNRFLLLMHEFPDGDAVGSNIALSLALRRMGKTVDVVSPSPLPECYSFLPGTGRVMSWTEPARDYDVAMLLDCADVKRAGKAERLLRRCKRIVNVDHHVSNGSYANVNLVDPDASATAELIMEIFDELGLEPTREEATCLYTAILTDTGSFQFQNTTPRALRAAARLVEHGANPSLIAEAVYENKSSSSIRLLGLALESLRLSDDGAVSWLWVTRDMLLRAEAGEGDSEGIINYARMIRGVEVAVLFKETDAAEVRVGLRSRHRVDVRRIADRFGGGGHARAAGCWVKGLPWEVERKVLDEVFKEVRESFR